MKKGRVFTNHDANSSARVVVVNEAFVRTSGPWLTNDPVGSRRRITSQGCYLDQGGATPLVRAYAIDCPRCSC